MCSVVWCNFSWEAFATIFAGLIAVGGAGLVAWRQQQILEKQTDILSHQITVERMKLRGDAFDRRWDVYHATITWLRDWYLSGDNPSAESDATFRMAIEKAKFLFRPEVYTQLQRWHVQSTRLQMLNKLTERTSDEKERNELSDRAAELSKEIEGAFKIVADLFASELKFTDSDASLPPLSKPDEAASA